MNDLLDGFQEGDIVNGLGIQDEEMHSGPIINIKKDEEGENIEICIEEDGEIIELKASSVKMENDRGNVGPGNQVTAGMQSSDPEITYNPSLTNEEQETSLTNLKTFSQFNGK